MLARKDKAFQKLLWSAKGETDITISDFVGAKVKIAFVAGHIAPSWHKSLKKIQRRLRRKSRRGSRSPQATTRRGHQRMVKQIEQLPGTYTRPLQDVGNKERPQKISVGMDTGESVTGKHLYAKHLNYLQECIIKLHLAANDRALSQSAF